MSTGRGPLKGAEGEKTDRALPGKTENTTRAPLAAAVRALTTQLQRAVEAGDLVTARALQAALAALLA